MKDNPKSLIEHVIELRGVLVNSSFAILLSMIACYIFIDEIFNFVSKPLFETLRLSHLPEKIIYTSVTEIFTTHMKLAFYTSILICFPYICWQFWKFVSPGLFEHELKMATRIISIAPILFAFGAAFAFYVVIPNVLLALLGNPSSSQQFLPKMSENISFILIMMLSFGISFQMPLAIFVLDKYKILRAKTLQKLWREVILAIIIVSAIITPPDVFSMAFLAAPLIVLYFASLLFCVRR